MLLCLMTKITSLFILVVLTGASIQLKAGDERPKGRGGTMIDDWMERAATTESLELKFQFLKDASYLARELNDKERLYAVEIELGHAYHEYNSFSNSLGHYQRALNIATQLDDEEKKASALNAIADV